MLEEPYICTILKYVHHFANIAKIKAYLQTGNIQSVFRDL